MASTRQAATHSPGKARRLRRLMSSEGQFCIVALDQRAILTRMLAQLKSVGEESVSFADLLAVKRLLVRSLSPLASAMLFDPNIAVPAALDDLPRDTGLLVSLEHHVVEDTPLGRKTGSIPDWSVEKIAGLGADGVKVLIWYHPDADPSVLQHQQHYVRSVGQLCVVHDLPFVLELLAYQPDSSGQHNTAITPIGSIEGLSDVVSRSVEEFIKPDYQVDLLKLESPVPVAAFDDAEALRNGGIPQAFARIGHLCASVNMPWVLLSAGVTTAQFLTILRHAYSAGAQGFLAGRAIWKAPMQSYPDMSGLRHTLDEQGVDALTRLIEFTQLNAQPYQMNAATAHLLEKEGDFARWYLREN